MDLYQVLGASRDSTQADLKKAYRAMVLKWHPDKNQCDRERACKMFRKVSEAYEVLSDPTRRMMYDQYGLEAVGAGQADDGMECADTLFREMFAHVNSAFAADPFMSYFDGPMNFSFAGCEPCCTASESHQVVQTLRCSLEELYQGCTKRFRITRTLPCGGQVEETLAVDVKAGWKSGTKVTFQGKGEPTPYGQASDLCFVLEEKEHDRFRREGNDLHVECPVSLIDALTGFNAEVRTLDNRTLVLPVATVVKPGQTLTVPGEGMPISRGGAGGERGDLVVHFAVAFPDALTDEQRCFLRQAFNAPPLLPHLLSGGGAKAGGAYGGYNGMFDRSFEHFNSAPMG